MLKKISLSLFIAMTCVGLHQPTNAMLEKDTFDFLSKKYRSLTKKTFETCYEESESDEIKKRQKNDKKSIDGELIHFFKESLNQKTLHVYGKEHETYVLNAISPIVTKLEKNHPRDGYFDVFFKRTLKNHTLLENITLTAEYIFEAVKGKGGGKTLWLGRTPCIPQVAYDEVITAEKDEAQQSVHINFSGHPDALTNREPDFFSSQTNIARDIVTPERLAHFFKYLDTKNILDEKKIFIVDQAQTTSSLNSFLRILRAYYEDREVTLPELWFFNLTQDVNWSQKSDFYTFEQKGDISSEGTLMLHANKKKNMKKFTINARGISIFDTIIPTLLDKDFFQEFMVHGIAYPAQKWTSTFDEERDKGGSCHKEFYTYLREQFANIISIHQNMKNSRTSS